jgi:hypothetical protein
MRDGMARFERGNNALQSARELKGFERLRISHRRHIQRDHYL